jgi:hypothetical protein
VNEQIKAEARRREITRLCHFTPSRNLGQILTGNVGILATKKLQQDERQVYTATDLQRLDGFVDHISATVEYPNAWYFEQARAREVLFRDWVVLFIDPKYLWDDGTRFCPRNAAASYGRNVAKGEESFKGLFAARTPGAYGRHYVRTALTPDWCTTDEQAEVLVPDSIAITDVLGIAVKNEAQARNELVRMSLLGIPKASTEALRISVAPDLFDKRRLSAFLKNGERPKEIRFDSKSVI